MMISQFVFTYRVILRRDRELSIEVITKHVKLFEMHFMSDWDLYIE